jgi:hypothetical protein
MMVDVERLVAKDQDWGLTGRTEDLSKSDGDHDEGLTEADENRNYDWKKRMLRRNTTHESHVCA